MTGTTPGGGVGRSGSAPQRPRDLFAEFPATTHDRLIVRYPNTTMSLTHSFADAAERLAHTYVGQAADDALLLPFLYLYRHAFELNLKDCITLAALTRRLAGDDDVKLEPTTVAERLLKKHGHRIMALVGELDEHMVALGLETMPKSLRQLHERISATDPRGESFRYPNALPAAIGPTQDYVDFVNLRAALHDGFAYARTVLTVIDVAHGYTLDMLADAADYASEYHEDLLAEQRAFEMEMRADLESYY